MIAFLYKVENFQMMLFKLGVIVLYLVHQSLSFMLILLSEFFFCFNLGNVSLDASETSAQDALAPSCTSYIVSQFFK